MRTTAQRRAYSGGLSRRKISSAFDRKMDWRKDSANGCSAMTLTTRVAIGHPIPVKRVYEYARDIVETPTEVNPVSTSFGSVEHIGNPSDVGAQALLWINYGADGPLGAEYYDPECSRPDGVVCLEVCFDTPYSAVSNRGEACGQLHARLVREMGAWIGEHGAPWWWLDERAGEWHAGCGGLEALQ